MNGKLIAIMGIDGSGKTTLVKNLEKRCCNFENWKFMSIFGNSSFTKELEDVAESLGKTRRECFSKEMRSIIWRTDLINNVYKYVVPELEKGKTVILDRYSLCSRVYSNLEMYEMGYMDKLLEILPKPDLGIYLDVDVDIAIKRIEQRNGKEIAPYEKRDGLLYLKETYEKYISQEKYSIIRLNANLSEIEVTKNALNEIINMIEKDGERNIKKNER